MARGLEAAHVDADLGDQHLGREVADAGDAAQQFDGGAKGSTFAFTSSSRRAMAASMASIWSR